jgi:hypothetical protein
MGRTEEVIAETNKIRETSLATARRARRTDEESDPEHMDTPTYMRAVIERLDKLVRRFDEEFKDIEEQMQDAVQLALDEREEYTKDFIRGILDEWWEEKAKGAYEEMRNRIEDELNEKALQDFRQKSAEIADSIDKQIAEELLKTTALKQYDTYVDENEQREFKKLVDRNK